MVVEDRMVVILVLVVGVLVRLVEIILGLVERTEPEMVV